MGQMQRVTGRATTVKRHNGSLIVCYHWTNVVVVDDDGTVRLNSGGDRSHTTKTRMNQASNQYGLGYQVFQKDFDWFVSFKGQTLPFSDGMELK